MPIRHTFSTRTGRYWPAARRPRRGPSARRCDPATHAPGSPRCGIRGRRSTLCSTSSPRPNRGHAAPGLTHVHRYHLRGAPSCNLLVRAERVLRVRAAPQPRHPSRRAGTHGPSPRTTTNLPVTSYESPEQRSCKLPIPQFRLPRTTRRSELCHFKVLTLLLCDRPRHAKIGRKHGSQQGAMAMYLLNR